jgi:glycerophosphoryl diester phosphodiesterase
VTLVSAHRCLTAAQIEHAIALGADYVEFDVQRLPDGSLVLLHDLVDDLPPGTITYARALELLAGRARAHLDLKLRGGEIPVVAEAVERLGTDRLLVTTGHDDAVRAIRAWADREQHDLQVGLSLGRGVRGFSLAHAVRVRISELFPGVRYRHSRANLVVAHHWLARLRVGRFARRHGLPLLVWTVDTPGSLAYWMHPGRAWMVTTNDPETALRLRADRLSP